MDNSIITDVKKIDKELETLHSEGASLRALQQQHDDDIKKRTEGVEAEYASTPSHMAVMSDVRFRQKVSIWRQKS